MASPRPVPRCALALAALGAAMVWSPSAARSEVVYKLETRCSLQGAPAQACTIEAENDGTATLYRHRIGSVSETIRITEAPVRMQRWDGSLKQWQPLERAQARFSTNTVCFNDRNLCVINPNYLNSIREDNPNTFSGRDLVKVLFDSTGRVTASCYDSGCDLVKK
ncbi:hypothetical protein KBZ20_04520 [Vulcanococcus limneticus Candia 3F8]|uniref:hypothetical protein n=1 Tax=Vulcanococcus limneticus TaxID=2170428 RepID=UPI000B987107|nr:hypothetical protein [Vulcanococcus limneticus]MCP9791355.1 hypothetical protein [Vulcanococcus limneticus MW73D5]MCP9893040.1 hypothetical protein [Vulcanococcus limneticus Candia 3F8]MCP9896822.1 hypothetical protein [Vulcanococcus limneticus Candia 3B3]